MSVIATGQTAITPLIPLLGFDQQTFSIDGQTAIVPARGVQGTAAVSGTVSASATGQTGLTPHVDTVAVASTGQFATATGQTSVTLLIPYAGSSQEVASADGQTAVIPVRGVLAVSTAGVSALASGQTGRVCTSGVSASVVAARASAVSGQTSITPARGVAGTTQLGAVFATITADTGLTPAVPSRAAVVNSQIASIAALTPVLVVFSPPAATDVGVSGSTSVVCTVASVGQVAATMSTAIVTGQTAVTPLVPYIGLPQESGSADSQTAITSAQGLNAAVAATTVGVLSVSASGQTGITLLIPYLGLTQMSGAITLTLIHSIAITAKGVL